VDSSQESPVTTHLVQGNLDTVDQTRPPFRPRTFLSSTWSTRSSQIPPYHDRVDYTIVIQRPRPLNLASSIMKSISTLTLAAATALLGAYSVSAQIYYGCFSSTDSLTYSQNFTFNSRGKCGTACSGLQMAVTAMTNEYDCYCGPTLPPSTDQVSNSSCNTACPGYPYETCMYLSN
jgi:hypothetical protein